MLQKLNEWAEQRPVVASSVVEPAPPVSDMDVYDGVLEDIPHPVEDEVLLPPVSPVRARTVKATSPLPPPRVAKVADSVGKSSLPPPLPKKASPSVKPKTATFDTEQEQTVGQGMVSPHGYSTILANVIKWLRGKNYGLLNTIYQQGTLVYLDQEQAILVFPTPIAGPILVQQQHVECGKQAFQQVTGRPIVVKAIDKKDPKLQVYLEAAKSFGGTSQQGGQSQPTITAPVVERSSEPEEIVQPTVVTQEVALTASHEEIPAVSKVEQTPESSKPTYVGTNTNSKVGAGSDPTNVDGIIDDFLTVYDNPEEVLNPYYQEMGKDILSEEGIDEIRTLPKWSSAEASDEEKQEPLLYDALQHMEASGYDIYVKEVDDLSNS